MHLGLSCFCGFKNSASDNLEVFQSENNRRCFVRHWCRPALRYVGYYATNSVVNLSVFKRCVPITNTNTNTVHRKRKQIGQNERMTYKSISRCEFLEKMRQLPRLRPLCDRRFLFKSRLCNRLFKQIIRKAFKLRTNIRIRVLCFRLGLPYETLIFTYS